MAELAWCRLKNHTRRRSTTSEHRPRDPQIGQTVAVEVFDHQLNGFIRIDFDGFVEGAVCVEEHHDDIPRSVVLDIGDIGVAVEIDITGLNPVLPRVGHRSLEHRAGAERAIARVGIELDAVVRVGSNRQIGQTVLVVIEHARLDSVGIRRINLCPERQIGADPAGIDMNAPCDRCRGDVVESVPVEISNFQPVVRPAIIGRECDAVAHAPIGHDAPSPQPVHARVRADEFRGTIAIEVGLNNHEPVV